MYTLIQWKLEGKNSFGETIHLFEKENLQVNTGKQELLKWIGNLATTSASGFTFLGYGASSFTPTVEDTRIGGNSGAPTVGYEYVGNGVRYTISNWTQSAEIYVYSGLTFTEKLTGSVTINGSTDLNASAVGVPIQSYALFNTWVLPADPKNTSGIMFNELVDDTQFLLKNGINFNTLSVTIVLRQ